MLRILIRLSLPVLVLVIGFFLMTLMKESGPKAKRQPPTRQARLVEVELAHFSNEQTLIHVMGTVRPAREVILQAQVRGEVMTVSDDFVPGGRFQKGKEILRIDPTDYKLLVQQRNSDVAQARSNLQIELGQQTVAKREYEFLGETIREEDRDLVLRKPQLDSVQAALDTAQAALEQAKREVSRTRVRSPFNAIVKSRNVDLGTTLSIANPLATLVGTDEYWVEVLVPVDQLKWILIPHHKGEKGSSVRVYNESAWGTEAFRTGHVIRLASDLEEEGRMAQVLVSIKDPLALTPDAPGQAPMMIGSYVRLEIDGTSLESVITLNRKLIRDGNHVWIMNDNNQLEIRPVEILFRARDHVLIRQGIQSKERIIVSHLAAPVPGMLLRTQAMKTAVESDGLRQNRDDQPNGDSSP